MPASLTAQQIAQHFSVATSTVRGWTIHRPPCPHFKDRSGRLRFDVADVQDWLETSGVGPKSREQTTQPRQRVPDIHIIEACHWTPEQVTSGDYTDDERQVVALHRTIATALFTLAQADDEDLPAPPDLDLHTTEGRDQAVAFLDAIPPRPREQWDEMINAALEQKGYEGLLEALA